jgi:hypothetical protein
MQSASSPALLPSQLSRLVNWTYPCTTACRIPTTFLVDRE